MKAFIDFETRSTVDLRRTGVYPYAMHPETDVWCMAYAVEFEKPRLWLAGDPFPEALAPLVEGGEFWAHNASFERLMWQHVMSGRYGWPDIHPEQWHCTAAEAARMALPRSLGDVCAALRVSIQKDWDGRALMLKMCRPLLYEEDGSPVWDSDPDNLKRLGEYCLVDVAAEQALWPMLTRLTASERRLYLLTEIMNDRGIGIDIPLIEAARNSVEQELKRHNTLLSAATSGRLKKTTQVAQLKAWLAEQGVEAPSLAKKAVASLLDDKFELPEDVRTVLEARKESSKSSVAKLEAMKSYSVGSRMHGLLMYCGARTGRWSGKGPQVQNFPRGSDVSGPERHIQTLASGETVSLEVVSALLRSMLIPSPGCRFLIGDFSQVEARIVAWLAGEEYMLQQFREKRPIYAEMAEMIFGHPVSKKDNVEEYTIGKSAVLGCGFQLGAEKFASQFGASEEVAASAVKAYRATYSHIVNFWYMLEDAALRTVASGNPHKCGEHISFHMSGNYLVAVLPSKRVLFYPEPRIEEVPLPWDNSQTKAAVVYSGVVKNRKWGRIVGYGGLWCENVTQAIARDLLKEALFRVEDSGYTSLVTVHDEIVAERADGEGSIGHFLNCMKDLPSWAEGLPVDAEGREARRWGK